MALNEIEVGMNKDFRRLSRRIFEAVQDRTKVAYALSIGNCCGQTENVGLF